MPIRGVDGTIVFFFIRPDNPRTKGERTIQYEQPKGTTLRIDIPPGTRSTLLDTNTPLWIADGPQQADALVTAGKPCIAVLGYRGWCLFRRPGRPALPDWDRIPLKNRRVIVAFSSDTRVVFEAKSHLDWFSRFLEEQGAMVQHAIPAPGQDGKRVAIDSFLAQGGDLDSLLADEPRDVIVRPSGDINSATNPYIATAEGFFVEIPCEDDVVVKPLTRNWTARIAADILVDDGIEQRRLLEIEGNVGGRKVSFRLTPNAFEQMGWVLDELGSEAITLSGFGIRDHVRAAIQFHSGRVSVRHEFCHTGWARHGGQWVYLHATGAIGAGNHGHLAVCERDRPNPNSIGAQELAVAGPVGPVFDTNMKSVSARLPPELAGFSLPAPPGDQDLAARRFQTILQGFLDVAKDHLALPLLGLVFRTVLSPVDFSVQLVGRTGVFKTSLAAVTQQFFGANLDNEHLVGHWAGTANSLESLAFHLKDTVVVIDDFSPTGSRADVEKLNRDAERLLRAKGNSGGRSRCRPDGTFRAARSPRASLLITGEDVPEGHSLRARLLTVEVNEGDINPPKLAHLQQMASRGYLAETLSAFLQWLAPQYDVVLDELNSDREDSKKEAIPEDVHRRTYHAIRAIWFGFKLFLRFGVSCGAIDARIEEQLSLRCWEALEKIGFGQKQFQQFADPVEQFLYLLSALFSSKRVHVLDVTGELPDENMEVWGCRRQTIRIPRRTDAPDEDLFEEKDVWVPCGAKIGWVSEPYFYFIPEVVFSEVQALAARIRCPIPVTLQTLEKRMADRDIILRDDKRV
jgi:hypothetical protein